MLECAIIDDEPLAREGIASYVKEIPFLTLRAVCRSPIEYLNKTDNSNIDLIFLDIEMPEMNGIEFLKSMPASRLVIITSAFANYALEGFQLNVFDYLLKPIPFDGFLKSVIQANEYHNLLAQSQRSNTQSNTIHADYFFIKSASRYEKVHLAEVLYFEAMQNYVTIHTARNKFMTLLTLKQIEEKLNEASFIRVHKSFIVCVDKISSVLRNEVHVGNHIIPLSRNYSDKVLSKVVGQNLLSKHAIP